MILNRLAYNFFLKEKNPNKRVQSTRHKVPGPLTRDVGATMIIEPTNPKNPVVGDTATSRPAPSLLG